MSMLACHYNQPKRPGDLVFDLLTLKVVSEARVTWATSMPVLVFLGLSVLELCPMYATDRQTSDVRQKHRLMSPPIRDGGIITRRRFENSANPCDFDFFDRKWERQLNERGRIFSSNLKVLLPSVLKLWGRTRRADRRTGPVRNTAL